MVIIYFFIISQLPVFDQTQRPTPSCSASSTCGEIHLPLMMASDIIVPQYDDTPSFSLEDARQIQNSTKEQALCPEWHRQREGRITASNFGIVMKRKKITEKFVQDIYDPKPFKSNATNYGSQNESLAKQKYLDNFPERHVHSCGLLLQPSLPFLGASPDGIVCDGNGGSGLLEIKCPFAARTMTVGEAVETKKNFYIVKEGDTFTISKMHPCYSQIQGQLLLSGLEFCDFVLYTTKDVFFERVHRDTAFINQMIVQLHKFHVSHFTV